MNCLAKIANNTKYCSIQFSTILFVLVFLMGLKAHAQCDVDAENTRTYQEVLQEYEGRIETVGTNIAENASFTFPTNTLLLIPNGKTFTGRIEGSNKHDIAICIAQGGVFTPHELTNFCGTILNYNTSDELNISYAFSGNIENYGGTVNVSSNNELKNGKYLLNHRGNIIWNGSLNVGNGCIYNSGLFSQQGNGVELQGRGCIHNDGWLTIENYVGANDFFNYGKVEILGKKLHFNTGGEIFNYCSFFSYTVGSSFQNNTNIYNYGLIYFPDGTWYNKNIFTNGEKGVVRTLNLKNEAATVTGSGRFYVTGYSENYNGGANFGLSGDSINFYDSSNTTNPGHFDRNVAFIGDDVFYTQFPEPEYAPDLSLYECGDIFLSEINAGEIGYDQIICHEMSVEAFVNISPAYMDGNPNIEYTWQYKFPNDEYFSNIQNSNSLTYDPDTATVEIQYRRKAYFSFPDTPVKNCSKPSNIINIQISDEEPPEITVQPSDTSVCPGNSASFSITSNDDENNQFRWMTKTTSQQDWISLTNTNPFTGATTNTLQISNTENINNHLFSCVVSSNACSSVQSNSAQITHLPDSLPTLTNPENQYLCTSETSTFFTVENENENTTFQWQESTDNGSTWNNITETANYIGVNTKTLEITGQSISNGNMYRCKAVSENGCFETASEPARLYIIAPNIIVEAANAIKCPDTDPILEFNGIDSNYQMGNSVLTFFVNRNTTGPFTWSFSYHLEISNPELLINSQSQGNIEITDTNTNVFPLTFYIENQTEEIVTTTLHISNVKIEGCAESSENNPNHTASMQVHKMPIAGEFKKD